MNLLNNRYRPCGPTEQGGTGTVLICEDLNLERKVAIKFLQNYREKRRILDEIAALQRIRSNNVVEIYDIVIEGPDNRIGVVQEYLPGRGLNELAPFRGSPDQLLRTLYQVLNGLADIHSHGLIHRDIKPNNMRMDAEGLVNIFDFDLARRSDGDDANTRGFRGTPGYAAPELYGYGYVNFDSKIDIYAFGVTAVALISGQMPGELAKQPPTPADWIAKGGCASLAAGLPKEIEGLIDKCLLPEKDARPTSAFLKARFAAQLLAGKHRALLVHNETTYVCDANTQAFMLNIPGKGAMRLAYDGLGFLATRTSGDVSINNIALTSSIEITGSCVLGFGASSLRAFERTFIALDISHPEVVL